MRRPNRMEERRQHALAAQRAFLRAAASLTEPLSESLAFALLEASIGILELAKADDDLSAHDRVVERLRGRGSNDMNIAEVREARLRAIQLGEPMLPEQLETLLYDVELALGEMANCQDVHDIEPTTDMMHHIVEALSDDSEDEGEGDAEGEPSERKAILAYLKSELLDAHSKSKAPEVLLMRKLVARALGAVKKGAHLR